MVLAAKEKKKTLRSLFSNTRKGRVNLELGSIDIPHWKQQNPTEM